MSKTAKEMWAEAGFKFFEENDAGIMYYDEDKFNGYINTGAIIIQINNDGSFKGFSIPQHSDSEEEAIEFTPDMSMALIQQIAEFKR